jgi:hypothetical protein
LPKHQQQSYRRVFKLTDFGNSSPGAYAKAYLPEFELISIVLFSSTVKVNGVLRISNSNFAGTATLPLLVESINWQTL